MDQHTATAYHEAAHAITLREFGCRVTSVCVNDDETGETSASTLPPEAEQIVCVALSGMQAEHHFAGRAMTFDDFAKAYAGGSGDRTAIAEETRKAWLSHPVNWHKAQYNAAQLFIERHEAQIRSIALAILAKPTFPKCLSEAEINAVLST